MPEPTKTPRKITLEDLLRLKRYERPGPEYWARFDCELNEKVWRALVQPAPRPSWIAALWTPQARWMAAGVAAMAAVFFSWPGQVVAPMVAARPKLISPLATDEVALPSASFSNEPIRVAEVLPAPAGPETKLDDAPAQFAVSNLDSSTNPAGNHKVPATVAFADELPQGVRYASATLSTAASATHWRESAY